MIAAIVVIGLAFGLYVRRNLRAAIDYESDIYRAQRFVPPRRSASYKARERAADALARVRARESAR